MANQILTIKEATTLITKAAAMDFVDNLQFGRTIDNLPAQDFKGANGYSAGDTVTISKPAQYIPQEGSFDATGAFQDTIEQRTTLKLNVLSSVPFEIDTVELATTIPNATAYYERAIRPAVISLAHNVESQLLRQASRQVYNAVGTPGSTVFDTDLCLSAREKMNNYLCPMDGDRVLLYNSAAGRSAVNARKGFFANQGELNKQYVNGEMGRADGFKWIESQMVQRHTNGNDVTGVALTANISEGASSIAVNGLTANTGTITAGTVFTMGIYAVHPQTKQVYPDLAQFTVVPPDANSADSSYTYTADANGAVATLYISPALYASGSRKNVSALPTSTQALTFLGAASVNTTQNMAYHKSAFRMVSVPLFVPDIVQIGRTENYKGYNVRIIQDWDNTKAKLTTRVDFLGGIAAVRPEWAARLLA